MKSRLYEYDREFGQIMDEADYYAEKHEGELPPDIEAKLQKVELERERLILNYGRWVLNNQAYIDMIDGQIKRLQELKRKPASDIKFAMNSLSNVVTYDEKFRDDVVQIKWNKGQAVDLVDELLIPGEFVREVETKYDKAAIKRALKSGAKVPGARLNDTYKLGVK